MDQAIVDLQSCHGTESPYVMLSRVTSLEGLAILRPFDKRKIQCRQSEDSRREARRLEFLRLHTVVQHGDEHESAAAQTILSQTRYHDQITMDVDDIETPTNTSNSATQLQRLQNSNYHLTSGPALPKLSNEDITMENTQNSSGMMLINLVHSHSDYLLQLATVPTTSAHVKKRTLPEHMTIRKKQRRL